MSQFRYNPQPSEYSFWDYSTPVFQTPTQTQSVQNYSPEFAPISPALWNALGPSAPAPTITFMGGSVAHPVPSPANYGYPVGPSPQSGGWPLPALTQSLDNSPAPESSTILSTPFITQSSEYSSGSDSEWTPNELWLLQALGTISNASGFYYATQQSEDRSSEDSAWALNEQLRSSTHCAQNYSPEFIPSSSTPLSVLGPLEPAPTPTVMMAGISLHPIPSPTSNGLYPGWPLVQNGDWALPALTHSRDNSPVSGSSAGPSTPPSGPPTYNNWPPVAQEFLGHSMPFPTNYLPEDPPPEQNGGDQTHATWNVSGHSTVSHSLLSEEGIVAKQAIFGLPTSAGQPYTSEIGVGNYAPYAPQVQSNKDNASQQVGKGKRKVDDSPWTDDSDAPSHKRVCHPVPGDQSMMSNQKASRTSEYQVETHQHKFFTCSTPTASAPQSHHAPALGWNGCRVAEKPTKGFKFYTHVGSVNSKGDASTRRWRMQDQDVVESLTASTAPEVIRVHEYRDMAAVYQPSTTSRVAAQDALSIVMGAGQSNKLASSRKTAAKNELPAARDAGSSSNYRDTVRDAVYEESGGFNRLRWIDGCKRKRRSSRKSSIQK